MKKRNEWVMQNPEKKRLIFIFYSLPLKESGKTVQKKRNIV